MSSLKFHLLDNALDSLTQGVQFALEDHPTSSRLKLSVLLTAQAVELVLKERLRQEHWSLVFRNLDQSGQDEAATVSTNEAIRRLERIARVQLHEKDKKMIRRLVKTRNRIQHYEIDLSFERALSQIHAAIAFLTQFLHSELQADIREHLDEQNIRNLLAVEEIATELRRIAQNNIAELEEENRPIRLSDAAAWHFEVIDCPACWEEFYVFSPDSNLSECQLCKYEGGFVECVRCGLMHPSGSWDFHFEGEEFAICESCWAYIDAE